MRVAAHLAAAAAVAALSAASAAAQPKNCGELPNGDASRNAYLRVGGPVPGAVDVLVCNRAYDCDPVLALRTTAPLALGWRGGTLVIAADTDALPVVAHQPRSGIPFPAMEIIPHGARARAGGVSRWLPFAPGRCTVPPPIR